MGYSHLQQKTGFIILPDGARASSANYQTLVDANGIVRVVPRRRKSASLAPLKLLVLLVVLVTAFKALSLTSVGLNDYQSQLSELQNGTSFERVAAWALQVDPATKWIYVQSKPYLR